MRVACRPAGLLAAVAAEARQATVDTIVERLAPRAARRTTAIPLGVCR